jgi:putative peptidoglycan lipid II flippase
MKQGFYLSVVVTMQLIATFATQLIVVHLVGIGRESDAYIAAQAVPSVLSAIIISALQSVWLPRMSVLSNDIAGLRDEQSVAQGQALIMGAGVLFIIWSGSEWWQSIIFPGLSSAQLERAHLLAGPLFIASAINIQSALLTIALRARDQFLIAEVVAMVGTVVSLVLIFTMLPLWGLEIVPWIAAGRALAVYFVQMGLSNFPRVNIMAGLSRRGMWQSMRPLLLGASIYKTSPLVDRFWTSQAPAGGMTAFSLAQSSVGALSTIIERSICMPLTPRFSRLAALNDYQGLRIAYWIGMKRVSLAVLSFGAIFILMNNIIISFAVYLFKINTEAAFDLWLICLLLLGFLHVAASGALAVAVFYAIGDVKTPVMIGICGYIIGLLLKWFMFNALSLKGIALATSIYYIFNIFVFTIVMHKKLKEKNES